MNVQSVIFPILALVVLVCGATYYLKSRRRRRKECPRRPLTDEQYNYSRRQNQLRIDAILDKISQKGYGSLSKEEKALLSNYE